MYQNRPCSSRSRAKNRWTRPELKKEVQRIGLEIDVSEMTLDQICQVLNQVEEEEKEEREEREEEEEEEIPRGLSPSYVQLYHQVEDQLPHGSLEDGPEIIQTVGRGTFGQIDLIRGPYGTIVTKSVEIPRRELKSKKKTSKIWTELNICLQIRQLILEGVTGHLPLLLGWSLSESCSLQPLYTPVAKTVPCLRTYWEQAKGTLTDWSSYDLEECRSVLFQVMVGLATLQQHLVLFHGDIKDINVLWYSTSERHFSYRMNNGQWYRLPTYGHRMCLIDYGDSKTFKQIQPKSESLSRMVVDLPSERVSALKYQGREHLFGFPCGKIQRSKIRIEKGFCLPAQLDWADLDVTVPYEFCLDLRDVLKSFVGGLHETNRASHTGLDHLPTGFKRQLEAQLLLGGFQSSSQRASRLLPSCEELILQGYPRDIQQIPLYLFRADLYLQKYYSDRRIEPDQVGQELEEVYHL